MDWIKLTDVQQLNEIREASNNFPVIIFKHSTSCSTSNMVINRLERNWKKEDMEHVQTYFLDLLSYREISNAIAQQFKIHHESPQVIIIKGGEATYYESHFGIDYSSVRQAIQG